MQSHLVRRMYRHFYFPDRIKYDTPASAGLTFEELRFASADGTQLAGWHIPALGKASDIKGTVVHLHGNAQNMTAHWIYAGWLPARGFNVLCFDYRGYGQSQGTPDPQGLLEDSIAALDHARARSSGKLFVFGQSLGGMLAISAAGASPKDIAAVAAEAPAYSYSAWADDQMPELQLSLDDSHCASAHVHKLAAPLLLLHSPQDRVVPYSHSEQLLAEAEVSRELITIDGGAHNDAMTDRHGTLYQDLLVEFFSHT